MQKQLSKCKQQGISLVGLIFVLAILGVLAVLGMKIVPTVSEYMAVKNAIAKAKTSGTTPQEIRSSFDKQADVAYITSITGKDLEVYNNGNGLEVSFAYDKKIPLVGPASLLIEYAGTTDKQQGKKPARDGGA
jgi:type II secretory pathway pseudopilin PulG